jgi:hypothetical protein
MTHASLHLQQRNTTMGISCMTFNEVSVLRVRLKCAEKTIQQFLKEMEATSVPRKDTKLQVKERAQGH